MPPLEYPNGGGSFFGRRDGADPDRARRAEADAGGRACGGRRPAATDRRRTRTLSAGWPRGGGMPAVVVARQNGRPGQRHDWPHAVKVGAGGHGFAGPWAGGGARRAGACARGPAVACGGERRGRRRRGRGSARRRRRVLSTRSGDGRVCRHQGTVDQGTVEARARGLPLRGGCGHRSATSRPVARSPSCRRGSWGSRRSGFKAPGEASEIHGHAPARERRGQRGAGDGAQLVGEAAAPRRAGGPCLDA
eukprot:scaffold13524_cov109-Isochrysis_galbana.AAC.2